MNGLALCAGAGGLELGLRIAIGERYRCVAYVERDAYAAACLVARMEDKAMDQAPIWDDLTTFDGAAWRGCVDIITAGFPCQPWSVAGKGKGQSDERWIWPSIADIICDVRPQFVFLENVPGLIVRDGLGPVLGRLAEMGFDAEWCVISAPEVGATQFRERLYIMAHTHGSSNIKPWGILQGRDWTGSAVPQFPPPPDNYSEWERIINSNQRLDFCQPEQGKRLSIFPGFTEWLMGLPIGQTAFGSVEMESYLYRQRQLLWSFVEGLD